LVTILEGKEKRGKWEKKKKKKTESKNCQFWAFEKP
jgi:hypothetical protein